MNETADNAPTLMVVDDDESCRVLLAQVFGRGGYHVIAASDGVEAQRIALENMPQLILMDIGMPDLDGLSALWRMREHPELAEVPVLIVTAYDSYDLRAEAASAGCQGYVTKPVDLDELKMLVDRCIRTSGKPHACCRPPLEDSELAKGKNLDLHPCSTRTARAQPRNQRG